MYRIGIDLGGTNIAAGIVDKDYHIVYKASVPTEAQRPAEQIAAFILVDDKGNDFFKKLGL